MRAYRKPRPALDQLREAIAEAEAGVSEGWQIPLMRFSQLMPQIWQSLPLTQRQLFLKKYNTVWAAFRHSMPMLTAKKLLPLLETNSIQVEGGILAVRPEFSGDFTAITKRGKTSVDLVINATGAGLDITKSENPLLKALINKQLINAHICGGLEVNTETCEVLSPSGKKQQGLYLAGSLTRGDFFYTNALEMNALQAQTICQQLINKLI